MVCAVSEINTELVNADTVKASVDAAVAEHLPPILDSAQASIQASIQEAVEAVIVEKNILDALPGAVQTATKKVLDAAKEELDAAKEESANRDDLDKVRDAATGWLGIVSTGAGLFGFASLIFGGGAVANLVGVGKAAVLVLFAAAVVCVGISMGLGAIGSHGWPRTEVNAGVRELRKNDTKVATGEKLAKAVFRLRASVYLAGVALVLLLLAALATAGLSGG